MIKFQCYDSHVLNIITIAVLWLICSRYHYYSCVMTHMFSIWLLSCVMGPMISVWSIFCWWSIRISSEPSVRCGRFPYFFDEPFLYFRIQTSLSTLNPESSSSPDSNPPDSCFHRSGPLTLIFRLLFPIPILQNLLTSLGTLWRFIGVLFVTDSYLAFVSIK